MPSDPLSIRDYLEATSDASKRTRTITIILAIASVLGFAGLLNSLQCQWMHHRMILLGDIHGRYTESKLGLYPSRDRYASESDYKHGVEIYERRYLELCAGVEKAYIDESLIIRVPFLGFVFDVNDLGLLAGIGFLVVLGCYRFFLSREIDNLRLAFDEAEKMGSRETKEFYTLLAMKQVFTVPRTDHNNRPWFLVHTPKLLTWFPLVVHGAITGHDLVTAWIGNALGEAHYAVVVSFEVAIFLLLLWLAGRITRKLRHMDNEWTKRWDAMNPKPPKKKEASAAM